jgi:hypothetical protein
MTDSECSCAVTKMAARKGKDTRKDDWMERKLARI